MVTQSLILTLLTLTLIIVLVWDVLCFPQEVANIIAEKLTKGKITNIILKKPWGCSLCLTFWLSLIYMLIVLPFTLEGLLLYILIALAFGYSTTYILLLINMANKLIMRLMCLLDRLIGKIH